MIRYFPETRVNPDMIGIGGLEIYRETCVKGGCFMTPTPRYMRCGWVSVLAAQ